jgi:dolichol-phosphate mannosyltransferase
MAAPELWVVMPAYNEAESLGRVVPDWLRVLDGLGIPYRLLVHDDGSRDHSAAVLGSISHPALQLGAGPNRGHGPVLTEAYARAFAAAPWVMQTDSDGEIPAGAFPEFWARRAEADLILGCRPRRRGPLSRRLISGSLRQILLRGFGGRVADGNCPFRLMRSSAFLPVMPQIGPDTFAPNVLLTAHALRARLRILELPVPHSPRQSGQVSIRRLRLLRAAALSALQTLRFRKNPVPPVR